MYLRRPLPKGRHAAEQSGEEEAGTVAGTNAAALRAWTRQVSALCSEVGLTAVMTGFLPVAHDTRPR